MSIKKLNTRLSATALLFLLPGFISFIQAQVTIGSGTPPHATLEVISSPGESIPGGLIPPRLTLSQLVTDDAKYLSAQTGAIVYVTDVSGTTTTKTSLIHTPGYYFFDGMIWQSMKSGSNITLRGTFGSNANIPMNPSTWSWANTSPSPQITSNNIVVMQSAYIDLPPGLWRLDFNCPFLLNTDIDVAGDWIEFLIGFTTNASATTWNSAYGGGVTDLIIGPLKAKTLFRGASFGFVENKSTTTQRYYMCIGRPTAIGEEFKTASFTLSPNGKNATIYATSTVFVN